jgi:choice-of-anchor B domain-containing protein
MITRLALLLSLLVSWGYVNGQELLAHWSDSTLVSSNAHRNTYNEVWGYAQEGREYAIIGSTAGTHIFDVTDPTAMVQLEMIPGGSQGGVIIHRDYHTYRNYLYAVADEGSRSTLQVIDLSFLPDSVVVEYDSADLIRRSHNIYIDTTHARLYSLLSGRLGQSGFDALAVYDITEPSNPVEIARVNDFDGFEINHVHDGYIEDNLAFFNCGFDGFAIVDVTDPSDYDLLSAWTTADYPQAGYNHSGWLDESGEYYYMSDETHGADMKVVDVRNLEEIRLVTTFDAGSPETFDIPHNQIVVGDRLYVSYYFDGLQVFDISDPRDPQVAWSYDTSEEVHTNGVYRGAWGVYPFLPSGVILVSDMQEGLFVLRPPVTSATEDETIGQIEVYPNPTTGMLTWDVSLSHDGQVRLYSSTGQLLVDKRLAAGSRSIDLSDELPSGNYILKLQDGTTTHTTTIQLIR